MPGDVWLLEDENGDLWSDARVRNRRGRRSRDRRRQPPGRSVLRPATARRRRRRMLGLFRLLVALALLAALVFGLMTGIRRLGAPSLEASGPPDDARLGPAQLTKLAFTAEGTAADAADQEWLLDGRRVRPTLRGGELVYRPRGLRDGEHEFEIVVAGGFLAGDARESWSFTVDTTAPKVRLRRPAVAYAWRPVKVSGNLDEQAVLRADGERVPVRDGNFTLRYETPPSKPVMLTATDVVGNASRWRMPITLVPRLPREPLRSVHVSADGWASPTLRQGVLQLIQQRRINSVELDLKDESGIVGWPAGVPLARRYGSVRNIYDLRAAVRQLHAKGVRVVGRLVAFRDPIHAAAAWRLGRRDEVIQTPDGSPYAGYGGFTNFANAEVRRYNIAIAVAAAKAGVDDVLYDYVRRPDGPISSMVFPGIRGTPEKAVADFLAETREALRPYGTFLGASVFGIAATRPKEVAQDIPAMARQVDYISPMVYPSHWAPYEYDVPDPNSQPYDIVRRSLVDFEKAVKGTGARVVPWLQDFSLGVTYGTAEVNAQIRATRDAGIDEFLLWDPAVTYTGDAIPTTAKLPAVGTAKLRKLPTSGPALVALGTTSPAPAAGSQAPAETTGRSAAAAKANELGLVPVMMHHRVAPDRDSEYDLTPREFRAELQRLWKDGFVPITAADLANRTIDIPAGKKPVVMTFDDGSESQFGLLPNGDVDPDTAVGIMLDFARRHPDFRPAGTFYVNRDPFAAGPEVGRYMRWLTQNGFELGNHTADHVALNSVSESDAQKQLVEGARLIESALPGYTIKTMALPFGAMPTNEQIAVRGSWGGRSYGPYAVMLVGANPTPSPFSSDFDPAGIPRIRTSQFPWRPQNEDNAFGYWIEQLEESPESLYVSDGDPRTISFPRSEAGDLAPRFKAKAKPY
jgi:peptidoglycan/xylan/chitin deacetylase (PgdA/CDA1 family)